MATSPNTLVSYPDAVPPLDGSEALAAWQNGGQKQILVSMLAQFMLAGLGTPTEQAAISAGLSQQLAALSLAQAQTAAAIQNSLPAPVVSGGQLPYEVSAISGGIGTGSGGTPGEYALGITGGPAGHQAFVTIGPDGKVASYRLANRGLSNSSSVPVYSFSTVPGLTGATLPAATVSTIAAGRVFSAPSVDGTQVLGWGNNAGALASAPFGGAQLALPTSSAIQPLLGVSSNFVAADTSNLNDPAFIPPGMASRADMVNRLYNLTTGALQAQSATAWPSWCLWMGPALDGGSTYTMNLSGAPTSAYFDIISPFPFFNEDGTFSQSITSGYTLSSNKRSITFTVPGTGKKRPAMDIRDPINWGAGNPMSLRYANSILDNIMVTAGSTVVGFKPHRAANAKDPDPAVFGKSNAPMTVAVQGGYAFIRAPLQQSATEDIVWRVLVSQTPAYTAAGVATKTGVVDFFGARVISRSTPAGQTIAAYNLSTQLWGIETGDERTPVHINGIYIGAGHGIPGYELTKAAHGKTIADTGSTWTDGAGKVWVLAKVVDANTLLFIADNTGASDKWVITSTAPSGTTMTHQSGATNTGSVAWTAAALGALNPILQNIAITLYVDDAIIDRTIDGVYTGSSVRIDDSWDIPNCGHLLAYLKGHIGSTDYTNSLIQVQVSVSDTFTWNEWGALTAYRTETVRQAFTRNAATSANPGDYSGAMQLQRLALPGDSTPGAFTKIFGYVPNVAPVSGLDLQATTDITALVAQLTVPKTACADPTDPASHFAQIGKDASGNTIGGMVYGYARTAGMAVPTSRAASVSNVLVVSTSGKHYPRFVDSAAGDGIVGQVLVAVAFRAYFKPTDPDLTLPAVIYSVGGKHYAIVTSHKVQAKKWVALPKKLTGWTINPIKIDAGVSMDGAINGKSVVQGAGTQMTFSNAYGDAVLELAP